MKKTKQAKAGMKKVLAVLVALYLMMGLAMSAAAVGDGPPDDGVTIMAQEDFDMDTLDEDYEASGLEDWGGDEASDMGADADETDSNDVYDTDLEEDALPGLLQAMPTLLSASDPVSVEEVPYILLDRYRACQAETVTISVTRRTAGDWSAELSVNGNLMNVSSGGSDVVTIEIPAAYLQIGSNTITLPTYEGVDLFAFRDDLYSEGRMDDYYDLRGKITAGNLNISETFTGLELSWITDPNDSLKKTFTATPALHDTGCDGTLTYAWNFGEGPIHTTATDTVEYTYLIAGSYTVTVTVTSADRASRTVSRTITVGTAIAAPDEVCNAESIPLTFTNSSFVDGDIWYAIYDSIAPDGSTVTCTAGPFDTRVGTDYFETGSFLNVGTYQFTWSGVTADVNVVSWIDLEPNAYGYYSLANYLTRILDSNDPEITYYTLGQLPLHCSHCKSIITGWRVVFSGNGGTFGAEYGQTDAVTSSLNGRMRTIYVDTVFGSIRSSLGGSVSISIVTDSPLVVRVNGGRICTYEIGEVQVTNPSFNGSSWTFYLDGEEMTSTTRTYIHEVEFTTTGTYSFDISPNADGSSGSTVSITVVTPITADFTPVVTPGSLVVDFVATCDIHVPSNGGDECIDVGGHSSGLAYGWVFETGASEVNASTQNTSNTYTSSGSKQVTLYIYDQHGEICATVTKTIVLSDVPAPEQFTITYAHGASNAADVTGMPSPDVVTLTAGEILKTPEVTPQREGYDFIGWQTSDDGAVYFAGDHFTMPSKNIVLTAQWHIRTYIVVFDYNGARSDGHTTVTHGSMVTEPETPEWSGYIFGGWLWDGVAYDFDTLVTKNITLVAQWSIVSSSSSSSSPSSSSSSSGGDMDSGSPSSSSTLAASSSSAAPAAAVAAVVIPPASSSGSDGPSTMVFTPEAQSDTKAEDEFEILTDGNVPLAGVDSQGNWGLLNLMLALVGAVLSILSVLRWLVHRREVLYDSDGMQVNSRHHQVIQVILRFLAIASGLLVGILFLLLEDLTQSMVWENANTLLILLTFIVQPIVLLMEAIAKQRRERNEERLLRENDPQIVDWVDDAQDDM